MFLIERIYLINRLLRSPLEILFTFFVFILSKNLNALPYQIVILACIKPISALFAFYANSTLFDNPHHIRRYLIFNNILGCILCFFYLFIENIWFYLGSYAIFMVTNRAIFPAWIETLKRHASTSQLSLAISRGGSLYSSITLILPLIICPLMDHDETMWRYLFVGFASIQFLSTVFIFPITIDANPINCHENNDSQDMCKKLLDPAKKGWKLLKENPPFFHYQFLFFLSGVGIIGSQSILPIYFKENLNLSYTQLGIAFSFCKSISFILTSPYWAKISNRLSLYYLNCLVNVFTSLFFAFLLVANHGVHWIYLAYFFYGVMQAGCEMSWNLAGPVFSKSKESLLYSSLSLACIGIRGCVCPFLGYLLFSYTNIHTVFTVSLLFCFLGIVYGFWIHNKHHPRFLDSQKASSVS